MQHESRINQAGSIGSIYNSELGCPMEISISPAFVHMSERLIGDVNLPQGTMWLDGSFGRDV